MAGCGEGNDATSSQSEEPSSDRVEEGIEFVDPQGTYTIKIDEAWDEIPGVYVKEIESWAIAPLDGGFAPNVNVLTQDAIGMSLAEYMDFSAEHLGGMELIDSTTVEGTNGNDLGSLEYTGVPTGGSSERPLHFLATVDVREGQAVVATLTTFDELFGDHRVAAEPYLRTLVAT